MGAARVEGAATARDARLTVEVAATCAAALSTRTRRLHLVTLLLVAVVWLGYVSPWGSDVMAWWLD